MKSFLLATFILLVSSAKLVSASTNTTRETIDADAVESTIIASRNQLKLCYD